MKTVTIYSKENCPYCDQAIHLAEMKQLQPTVFKLDEDFDREEFFEKFPNARSFPQIEMNGELVGGYTEFLSVLAQTVTSDVFEDTDF